MRLNWIGRPGTVSLNMHDGHLHVKELDGNVSVPVAGMHC